MNSYQTGHRGRFRHRPTSSPLPCSGPTISPCVPASAPLSVCSCCSARVLPIRPLLDLRLRSDSERRLTTTQQDGALMCRTAGPSFPSSQRRVRPPPWASSSRTHPCHLRSFTLDFPSRRAGSTCRLGESRWSSRPMSIRDTRRRPLRRRPLRPSRSQSQDSRRVVALLTSRRACPRFGSRSEVKSYFSRSR